MPCVPIPKLPLPALPDGINLTLPLPPIPALNVSAPCCILPPLQTPQIPIPLPPLFVNPAFVETLRVAFDAIEAYEAMIPLDCPRS